MAVAFEETFGSCLRLVASPTVTPLKEARAPCRRARRTVPPARAAGAERSRLLGRRRGRDEALAPLLDAALLRRGRPLFSTTTSTITAAISTIVPPIELIEGDALAAGLARLALPQLLFQLAAGRLAALAPGVHRGGVLLRSGRVRNLRKSRDAWTVAGNGCEPPARGAAPR